MTMNDESRASVKDGGPAYPVKGGMCFYYPKDLEGELEKIEQEISNKYEGMTLRDYFAGQALSFLTELHTVTNDKRVNAASKLVIARHAYEFADAMIQARGH